MYHKNVKYSGKGVFDDNKNSQKSEDKSRCVEIKFKRKSSSELSFENCYLFSEEAKGQPKADWLMTFIGNYKEALLKHDIPQQHLKQEIIKPGYPNIKDYKSISAITYIIDTIASHNQVVFINEAHHVPQHRAFVTLLLEGFRNQGFRYLFVEALSYDDSTLNQRNYPVLNQDIIFENL